MKSTPRMLSDVIDVRARFQRSVNLEKDYWAEEDSGSDYIVTLAARKALRFILEGLEGEGAYRALTVTGPYGVGKSAFGLFLTQLLCGSNAVRQTASRELQKADPRLALLFTECTAIEAKAKGFLPILLTARRAPAPLCVLQGIGESLSALGNKKLTSIGSRLRKQAEQIGSDGVVDSRVVADCVAEIARVAKSVGYAGVLVIVDELGKLFEYAARDPRRGDVYVFQELAEQAARSGDAPLVLVGLLHQGFDEYAKHLDLATRQEWGKIQGRFTDIAFQEPTDQLIRLVASALHLKLDELPLDLRRYLRQLAKGASASSVAPPSMAQTVFDQVVGDCFPLHPTALVALPILFNRFAQNERSLFSYLTSLEPGGFQDFLRTHPYQPSNPPLIRLPQLFDYFSGNFGAGLYRQPHARRWLEAADALERREDLTAIHRDLVKTIGVLSVVGEFSHLHATESVIAFAMDDSTEFTPRTRAGIKDLLECSLLTYRKFNHTYRVWEGSDIDIEERIAEGTRKVRRSGLGSIIEKYLITRPLVARRHSFETGALRYFDLTYVDAPDDIAFPEQAACRSDGRVVVCLAESSVHAQAFKKRAGDASERLDVLFAIPQQIGDLNSAALELAALRWTWDNTPELRDDRVARREIALRITEAELLLTRNITGLLDPRPEPIGSSCLWFWRGKSQQLTGCSGVSQLLSRVCDELYKEAPRIRNELVSRRSLSSAAAAARRNLVEAMLLRGDQPLLGIEGFPPERSMYESVLLATGIHAEREGGRWGFSEPTESTEHNLHPAWTCLCSCAFGDRAEPIALDQLFGELSRPPVGLMDGLHPLLLCAFMLVHRDETTLYREGTFIPEPSIADFEILLRRPELFAVAGSKVEGGRRAVVERLATGLNTTPATVPVVRALFGIVKGLPEFAWKTRQLPDSTIRLRQAFEDARAPEEFLFAAVPEALGLDRLSKRSHGRADVNAFFDALNENLQAWAAATPNTIRKARDTLLRACGLDADDGGWRELRERAIKIESSVTDTQLLAFVKRLVQAGAEHEGVETVLALVASRPPQSWSDVDVERFPGAAEVIGRAFARAVRTAGLTLAHPPSIDNLPTDQQDRARSLLNVLRENMARHSGKAPRSVLRAVVAELAAEIDAGVKESEAT